MVSHLKVILDHYIELMAAIWCNKKLFIKENKTNYKKYVNNWSGFWPFIHIDFIND